MDVARRARTEYGIHIHRYRPPSDADGEGLLTEEPAGDEDLDLQDLCPLLENERIPATAIANGRMFSRDHVVLARIVYPPGPLARAAAVEAERPGSDPAPASDGPPIEEGLLIYVKPTLTGDEDADLIRFWGENPEFPHDSTMDQFYTPAKFESYRQLGAHTGRQVIRRLAGLGRSVIEGDLGEPAWRLLEFWAAEFGDRSDRSKGSAATLASPPEPATPSPPDGHAPARKGRRSPAT
jgi:hypothetical protein